jgi:hypothetical protein
MGCCGGAAFAGAIAEAANTAVLASKRAWIDFMGYSLRNDVNQ